MDLPKLGISHGDINGIGYEVLIKAFAEARLFDCCIPIVYGYSKVLAYYRNLLGLEEKNINIIKDVAEAHPCRLNVINCSPNEAKVEMGVSTLEAGQAAFAALEMATADLQKGAIQALVTAPINKQNIQSDKFHFQGHTEYFESKANATALMLFVGDMMRVALVTNHVPISQLGETITTDLVLEKLRMFNATLKQDFMIDHPRIAVLSLNPHVGDGGLIGDEDDTKVKPAVTQALAEGIECAGPFAADGFFGAVKFRKYDGVLAMYHDQALIPFKTLCPDGVNYSAGLPFVRTSPCHGTAYELVGKGVADESSFRQAVYLALDIAKNRSL